MTNWRRAGAAFGLVFVITQAVGGILFAPLPGTPSSITDLSVFGGWFANNQHLFLAASWVLGLGAVSFLGFLVAVRYSIERNLDVEWHWLSTLVFGAGVVAVAELLASAGSLAAAAVDVTTRSAPSEVWTLFEHSGVIYGTVGLFPFVLVMGAASYAFQKSKAFPAPIILVGYLAALLNFVTTFSIFAGGDPRQFFSATGLVGMALGGLPTMIWTALLSVVLLKKAKITTAAAGQ